MKKECKTYFSIFRMFVSEKLVKNILNFVEMNYPEEKEQYNVLRYFLNDIPGLTDAEIRKVYL